jgi:hypothetical protein
MEGRVLPRALVVVRVERGATRPSDADIRRALQADRAALALPPVDGLAFRLAGPYPIVVDGRALDEYVAWEV